mmetsp:Transcript_34225/g.51093  ORF Transcript_34225/g.51093 Transcript_34225/m.51093 type:complete len:360 (-) Transcript_34225:119-1198(-)
MNITTPPKNKTLLYCITLIVISYCNGLPLPTTSKTTTRRSSYSSLLYFLPKEQQQSIQTKSIKIPSHTTTKPLATTTKLSSSSIPLTEDFEKDDDNDDDTNTSNKNTPQGIIESYKKRITSSFSLLPKHFLQTQYYKSYMTLLQTKPFLTKSITCGIISVIGDVFAQMLEQQGGGGGGTATTTIIMNWKRLSSFFISGTIFVGPFLCIWYDVLWQIGEFLDGRFLLSKQRLQQQQHTSLTSAQSMTVNKRGGGRIKSLLLMLIDQTIGVALFFPAYFYVYECTEALVHWRAPMLSMATNKIRNELYSILIMNYRVWPIVNYINFEYVPETLRILVSNLASVFWNIYLCTRVAAAAAVVV